MTPTDRDVSRTVSHALRHDPDAYGLELDGDGWVSIDDLVTALHGYGAAWTTVTRADVEHVVATAGKRRHEIAGDRIRALYGHSLPDRIDRTPEQPPSTLFHGTSPAAWEDIRRHGLAPMARQYVHLSTTRKMAAAVGRRKAGNPLLLLVDAARASADGVPFYPGNGQVWLADTVAPDYLALEE